MKKSERLNDMIRYLNDKHSFRLKDLMQRYRISKSTALRDVQSLESLGMPIYTRYGRNGYYGLLKNKLLSPILFELDEVLALYFSMCTLNAYAQTPFHLSVEKLKSKFESCLSEEKISLLKKWEKVFSFAAIKQQNPSPYLKEIVQYAVEETVCDITYQKGENQREYRIQFFKISSAYGQWYATAYYFQNEEIRVFRCDKILKIEPNEAHPSKELKFLLDHEKNLYKKPQSVDFMVEISKKGVDLYDKENYPSMQLIVEKGRYFIQGFYNEQEEEFIANYFINYGREILCVEPPSLKDLILRKSIELKEYFLSL